MFCNTCQQQTTPIKVAGDDYCSNCGNKYVTTQMPPAAEPPITSAPAAPTSRRVTDLSLRRTPATPPTPPAPAPATHHHAAKPAAAVHHRAKPGHILDLRANDPKPSSPPAATSTVNHASHTPAPPPKTAVHEHQTTHISDRLNQAKQYDRSPHISKFPNQIATPHQAVAAPPAPAPTPAPEPSPILVPEITLPNHTATQHQAMSRLIDQLPPAADPATPAPKPQKTSRRLRLSLSPQGSRVLATGTAVVIMAGYIWLHNYPKLAIQAANSRAGLSASLPGYMPSSYSLAHTDTGPGLVTLSFASPSANESLKIAQNRTSWDSSSLLENFVNKNTDDYTTVQNQGLTIYLFGQNQATWVNHGIWYSIEGATKLSREQILKIAYSL